LAQGNPLPASVESHRQMMTVPPRPRRGWSLDFPEHTDAIEKPCAFPIAPRVDCIVDLSPYLEFPDSSSTTSPSAPEERSIAKTEDDEEDSSAVNSIMDSSNNSVPPRTGIDPYELYLLELIGEGRSSQVFLAQWTSRNEVVAVKEISSDSSLTDKLVCGLEGAIWCEINHPNIVKLLGVIKDSEPIQVVVQYCAGGSCFDLLHLHPELDISLPQKGKMLNDVAAGMEYLHGTSPQIIHGDLRSHNVLLVHEYLDSTSLPTVQISVFDSASMPDCSMSGRKMSSDLSTVRWRAPELLAGEKYNANVDVYSYGMFMYEMLNRSLPFGSNADSEVEYLVLSGLSPSIPDGSPCEALRHIMVQCWCSRESERPPFTWIASELYRCDSFGCAAFFQTAW